ncbi:MAG: VOC family protein [Nocardiopsaceae bacterium]|nr:VOC family protein [Nocardiopsaceae bacterium]
MPATATLAMVNIDCGDPRALAAFYADILGWTVLHSQDEYAMIGGEGASIGFGRVKGHRAPSWPGEANDKRFHLDFYVDDLDQAEKYCRGRGATTPDFQPGEHWRVLLDPDGHPFCICLRRDGDGE